MDPKIIEFSFVSGWEWFIQLLSIGLIALIFAILIIILILLIRKLKKKN